MKKRIKKKKRETLRALLIRYLASALILTAVFAVGFQTCIVQYIRSQCRTQIEAVASDMQQKIHRRTTVSEGDILMQDIGCILALYQNYYILLPDLFGHPVYMTPRYSPKCHSGAALIDENGEIVASNKLTFLSNIIFSDDPDDPAKGWYTCDREKLDLPEVDQMYADYLELAQMQDIERFVEIEIESAYVNRETHSYIPHKGVMMLTATDGNADVLIEEEEKTVLQSKAISITVEDESYELVTLHNSVLKEYPRAMLTYPQGEKPEDLEQFRDEFIFRNESSYSSSGWQAHVDGTETFTRNIPIYLNKQTYWLTLCLTMNLKDPSLVSYYWREMAAFAVLVFLIALALCRRRYFINKTKYAFEDYQRDLTNHLAHDIKTPLTAIGGYTENLMEGQLTEEEQQRYLRSILDNVAFTDSIIRKTLYLNSMDGGVRPERKKTDAGSVIQKAFEKYALLLEEKHILYSVSGSAEITADAASFETVIENLVSNAVKYTPENGSVKAELDKKRLVLSNTVPEKIGTKNLMRPFYRGDKTRSNADGAGLGLSIAERAAEANGFSLKISCTDTEFKAELKF